MSLLSDELVTFELAHKKLFVDILRAWITIHKWMTLYPNPASKEHKAAAALFLSTYGITGRWLMRERNIQIKAKDKWGTGIKQNMFGAVATTVLPKFVNAQTFKTEILPNGIKYLKGEI